MSVDFIDELMNFFAGIKFLPASRGHRQQQIGKAQVRSASIGANEDVDNFIDVLAFFQIIVDKRFLMDRIPKTAQGAPGEFFIRTQIVLIKEFIQVFSRGKVQNSAGQEPELSILRFIAMGVRSEWRVLLDAPAKIIL